MEDLATVDTAQVETPQFTIDTGTAPSQPPSEEVAKTRAYKAHMGLGDIIKQGYDEIYRNIADGKEDAVRQDAALTITANAVQKRQQDMLKMAAEKGSNLSLQDVQSLQSNPADPKSVIEQGYSRAYVNTIKDAASRIDDNVLTDAQAQNPEAVDDYMNRGSEVLSKREYAITKEQNLQTDVDKNAWFGFKDPIWGDQHNFGSYDVKQLLTLGFYESAVLRGNTEKTSRLGFLGNVLGAQAKELLELPFPEFQKEFDRISDNLKGYDPILAQQFAHAVSGMSTSEQFLNNAIETVNVATAGSIAGGLRNVLKGVGERQAQQLGRRANAASDQGGLVRGADGVYRQAPTGSTDLTVVQAQQAVKDVVQSSTAPEVTKATIAEGAGDVKEAGVQKSITSIITRPDPAQDAQDTLLSNFRANTQALKEQPGNLSREEHTRLIDAANSYEKNATDVIVNTTKVVRTPGAAETGFREMADRIKDNFPGRENTILDVKYRYDPVSNTQHHDVYIGNYDGTTFSSTDLALRHAEINGYGNPIIVGKATERVYIPAAAARALESVKTEISPETAVLIKRLEGTNALSKAQLPRLEATINDPLELKRHPPDTIDHYKEQIRLIKEDIPKNEAKIAELKKSKGSPRFYIDQGIEVYPSASPIAGHIPYNLKTGKFEPAVTAEQVRIEQQGLGFHIIRSIALDETSPFIRDGLIADETAKSTSNITTTRPTSIANAVIGYIRSPNDTLSKIDVENRVKTVYSRSRFLNLIKDEMSYVEDLYKGLVTRDPVTGEKPSIVTHYPASIAGSITGKNQIIWNQFVRALKASEKLPDPATGLPGYYMKTPAEIQDFWLRTFQRPAGYAEQQAYLAVGRLDNFDHMLRNVSVYRNKARLGVQSHTLYSVKDGQRVAVATFDAQPLNRVQGSTEDVMLIHHADGTEQYWHSMNPKAQQEFRKLVEEGRYKGAQIYDTEKRPISRQDIQNNPLRIRYVFSNSMETTPISYDQVGFRGGGHWNYDYEHYVKQPIVRPQWVGSKRQNIYEGDSTFAPVSNHAMGEDFAKHMNTIADLIHRKQYKDARAYAKSVFDIEWKDIYKGFNPSVNPLTGESQPARFSKDPRQKFRVVSKGNTIHDLDKQLEDAYTKVHPKTGAISKTFVDGTRHGSLARNFQVEYTGTRDSYDLFEPNNTGTVNRPFYKFQPAKMTDPIVTLTRSLERIVNSIYMDDYKIFAAEHWIEENKHLLKATDSELRSSPFYYFNNGEYKKDAPTLATYNAESNRYKAQQLIGTPSKIDTVLHGIKQELSDAAYERTGKVTRSPLIAAEWLLDKIHHPVDFFRGMTFHKYLGLFNPVQLVTQNMSYATLYSLARPGVAAAGSFGALMHQWSRINKSPAIVDAMDRHAVTFGWRLGEFKEGMKVLERTGFANIAGELALDNGMRKESFTRLESAPIGFKGRMMSGGRTFLHYGQVFFNAAERNVRFGAWYAAFHEFRAANPFMEITPTVEGRILRRANDFYTNMSRDSNSMLNKGITSVPLQFFAYQQKLGELFWSKRLGDNLENKPNTLGRRLTVRAKMFVIYSMLYGMVGATGLSLIPGGDIIRQKALEKGYVVGKDAWTYVMEGPLAVALHAITGTWYNLNNRYGANGYSLIRDLMRTDPTFWKILTGAAGTDIANTLASLDGFTNAMYSMIKGKKGEEAFPLTIDDWTAPLKTVSSYKYADRLVYALEFGKWLDVHGRPVQDIGKMEAVFRTLTGLQDVRQDDIYLMNLTKKDEDARFKQAINQFEHYSRLADQAAANKDPEQANDYNKKAFFELRSAGVPPEMYGKAIARRATMNKDTIEKAQDNYYRNFVPTDRQDAAREADRSIQQMKDK